MSTGPTEPITLEKIYDLLQIMQGRMDAVETRQYTTTPSWVTMLAEKIDGLRTDTERGFARVEKEISLVKRELRNLHGDFGTLRATQEELEERIERIEGKN